MGSPILPPGAWETGLPSGKAASPSSDMDLHIAGDSKGGEASPLARWKGTTVMTMAAFPTSCM